MVDYLGSGEVLLIQKENDWFFPSAANFESMKRPLVLGIAGGSGSGKSTIVERLMKGRYGQQISLLAHDSYYLGSDRLPRESDGAPNWDHPEALDNQLLLDHLDELIQGKSIESPSYDFNRHTRTSLTRQVPNRPVILLEGILLFAIKEIRDRIDLRIYVETPADIRIVRRTVRDIEERGRDASSVAAQYHSSVRPMHELHVEPSKYFAHIWIPWIEKNDIAIEVIESVISTSLNA